MVRSAAPLAVLAFALAACPGGSSPPANHRITGTVSIAASTTVDSDVNDPAAPFAPNDDDLDAQPLASPVRVGGWASAVLDPSDVYAVHLVAGQRVTLAVADPVGVELDLCARGRLGAQVCSVSTVGTATQQVDVTAEDDYLVDVIARTGASSYLLDVGFAASAAAVESLRTDREFVPGEVVVVFRDGASGASGAGGGGGAAIADRARALGLVAVAGGAGGAGRAALLDLGTGAARGAALAALGVGPARQAEVAAAVDPLHAAKLETLRAVAALRRRADVVTADPNYVFRPAMVPADELYAQQWHYRNIGTEAAWNRSTGRPASGDVIVAVIDTGVFLAHPDFAGQLVPGYDFIQNASQARDGNGIDPNPDDPGDDATAGKSSWHGTHVAGTIVARTSAGAGSGGVGVAFGAKVMPLRALGVGGGTSYDIRQALLYAARLMDASGTVPANDSHTLPERRADVVNLSLGCGGCRSAGDEAVLAQVRQAGVVVVAAAGNENTSALTYPASYPGVISVSAVTKANELAAYSNHGAEVDVAAPGGYFLGSADKANGILSTFVDDRTGSRVAAWAWDEGTSMAAPHVAGVVALMKAACPTLDPDQLDVLLASGRITTDLGEPFRDGSFGHGLIDAAKAVNACGDPTVAALSMTPAHLELASAQTTVEVTAAKVGGTTPVAVTGVTSSVPWLTVAPKAVDAAGLGTYEVRVSAAALPDGTHAARLTFAASGTASATVAVTLQKGTAPRAGAVGNLHVLLLRADGAPVGQRDGLGGNGVYPYAFTAVPDGTYRIFAGTDLDGDTHICDAGEACGGWTATPFDAIVIGGADRDGIDFTIGFDPARVAAPTGGIALPLPPQRVPARSAP
jgi:serine protease